MHENKAENHKPKKPFFHSNPKNHSPKRTDAFMDDSLYSELKSFINERRKQKEEPAEENANNETQTPSADPSAQAPKNENFQRTHERKGHRQKPQKKHIHHHSKPLEDVSLEPRDAQHFLLKPPKNPAQKTFPYLTPHQSFAKHMPYPKEIHKKRADKDVLRIIPFGGLEQVGINCIGFEYNNEIIIVDMGIQFPDEHMHGVQGSIPDISYVKGKKVIAVLITHGHIDHIGGIPYLMRVLGANVPMYATPMALELIKVRQQDYKMPLNLKEFQRNKVYPIGDFFYAEAFTVDHSIPDSAGIRIHTPVGKFIHTGDWKFDSDPREGKPSADHEQLMRFGKEGVRALLSDSTNAHLPGSALAEKVVVEPLEGIFEKAKGRIFTGTFSSIVDRLQIIIETAEKFDRKVVLLGRGMNTYFEIAKKLGYIKNFPNTLISTEEINNYPDDKICICCTGAQGERYAALMRIATGESNDAEFKPGDTVILSSSVIPGNERKVQELMDLLYEQGVEVHHYRQSTIHAGGHAREEDVKLMIEEVRPEIFIPIYGNRFMIHANANIAKALGYSDDKVFIARNGQIMEFTKTEAKLTNLFAPHRLVTVDGYMVGLTSEKELVERYQMKQCGVVIVNITEQGGKPRVHFISHGFVTLSMVPEIHQELLDGVLEIYRKAKDTKQNRDDYNRAIRKRVQNIIWTKLAKEPVVIIAS